MSDEAWKFVQYDTQLRTSGDEENGTEATGLMVDAIQQKGFCVINLKADIEAQGDSLLAEAAREVTKLEESGRLAPPPEQVVNGLLGEDGSSVICELETDPDAEEEGPSLMKLDKMMTSVMTLLAPVSEMRLGVKFGGRTSPVLHVTGVETEEEDKPKMTEADADKWLSLFVSQRLMVLLFLGPGKGHLELRPFRHEDATLYVVSTEAGTAVVLRTDTLTHRYYSYDRSVVMSSWLTQTMLEDERNDPGAGPQELMLPTTKVLLNWISERMTILKQSEVFKADGHQTIISYGAGTDVPREWQSAMNHTYVRGQVVAMRGMACQFPTTWDPYCLWCASQSGCDLATEIPLMRWNHDNNFDANPESWKMFKSYAKHGVFIEGADLFDPKPFGLAVFEAKGMDPCQRHILEVSYQAMTDGGFTKKQMMRGLIGVYIGAAVTEFQYAENCNEGVGTSCAGAITSNRISFCLGMQGPSFTIDAGGASSMAAMASSVNSIRFQTDLYKANTAAIAGGVNLLLAPQFYVLACAAGFLSPTGRTLSFDVTASGYVRGEGCGGICITPLADFVDGKPVRNESRPNHGSFPSIAMGHCGKTASLVTPSGPVEASLICEAVRQASISPLDVDYVEAWGEGGVLSDAVNIKALTTGYRDADDTTNEVLGIAAIMSGFGFMHETVGMAQLFKVIFSNKAGTMVPTIHLNELNPHIDAWDGEAINIQTECVHTKRVSTFSGVAARSSSGTLCHCVVWGELDHNKYLPRVRDKSDMIAFWPGGGGELPEEAEPSRAYWIAGSWTKSQWAEAEVMKGDGEGLYVSTVTLGPNCFENFQIWLDGNSDRALHPGIPNGEKNLPVKGPNTCEDCEGLTWLMDGREQMVVNYAVKTDQSALEDKEAGGDVTPAREWQIVQDPYHRVGSPGDKYKVRLHVAGKWRTVDWVLEEPAPKDEAYIDDGVYYVVAGWNDWSFASPMTCTDPEKGIHSFEVELRFARNEFQIVRNKDWHQVFAPGGDGETYGPGVDTGFTWLLPGTKFETYRITLQRTRVDGVDTTKVSWEVVKK